MSAAPGIFRPPPPQNEPVKDYAPGTPEREELRLRLQHMRSEQIELPLVIGGEEVRTRETLTPRKSKMIPVGASTCAPLPRPLP